MTIAAILAASLAASCAECGSCARPLEPGASRDEAQASAWAERVFATARLESAAAWDDKIASFAGDKAPQFGRDLFGAWFGPAALSAVRKSAAEIVWARAPRPGAEIVRAARFARADPGALGAALGVEIGDRPTRVGEGGWFAVTARAGGVVLAQSAEAIEGFEEALDRLEPRPHVLEARLWPERAGLKERWAAQARDLDERLGAAGHDLAPARAALIQLQIAMLEEVAEADWGDRPWIATGWPKPKSDQDGFKDIRWALTIPVPEGAERAEALHGALAVGGEGSPPAPREQALVTLRATLGRARAGEVFDALIPEPWRQMIAARGSFKMGAARAVAGDLLEHNRGATLVALYEQRAPLSAEMLLAFEVMDKERFGPKAEKWAETAARYLWAPLHLAEPDQIRAEPLPENEAGLRGGGWTFPALGAPARIGICWGADETHYWSYYGVDPCARLIALAPSRSDAPEVPARLDVNLEALLDALWAPPGSTFSFEEEGARALGASIEIFARGGDDRPRAFELSTKTKDAKILEAARRYAEALAAMWAPPATIDLAARAASAGGEAAIYQEPSLMLLGPPGGIGALPPQYLLGLPFSVAPAPPSALRRALIPDELERDTGSRPARKR